MFFKKKEPARVVRSVTIPPESVREILELWDKFSALPVHQDHTAKYDLWAKIKTCIPDLPDKGCQIKHEEALVLKIEIE